MMHHRLTLLWLLLLPLLAGAQTATSPGAVEHVPPAVTGRPVSITGAGIALPPTPLGAAAVEAPEIKLPAQVTLLNDGNYRTGRDWCAQYFSLSSVTAAKTQAPRKVGLTFSRGRHTPCLAEDRRVSFEVAREGKTFVPLAGASFLRDSKVASLGALTQAMFVLTEPGQYQFRARVEIDSRGALVGPVTVVAN